MRPGAELEAGRIDVTLLSDFADEALFHPEARGLFTMWTALRAGRPAPFRAELDAARIGARAPFLAILEYVGPSNFRIRIAGDRLNRWFGLELRGMSALSLVEATARNHLQSVLNRLTTEPAVGAARGEARNPERGLGGFEMVLLPMRSDFGRIDRVLLGLWLEGGHGGGVGPIRLEASEFVVAPIIDETLADEALLSDAVVEAPPAPEVGPPAGPDAPSEADPAKPGEPKREIRRGHLRLVKG